MTQERACDTSGKLCVDISECKYQCYAYGTQKVHCARGGDIMRRVLTYTREMGTLVTGDPASDGIMGDVMVRGENAAVTPAAE